jgi:acetolactate synthase-1/2/3 large subunit
VSPCDYPDPPAHYFGVSVVAALTPDALEHALCKAFAAAGPTVIEAMVDGSHYSETVYD